MVVVHKGIAFQGVLAAESVVEITGGVKEEFRAVASPGPFFHDSAYSLIAGIAAAFVLTAGKGEVGAVQDSAFGNVVTGVSVVPGLKVGRPAVGVDNRKVGAYLKACSFPQHVLKVFQGFADAKRAAHQEAVLGPRVIGPKVIGEVVGNGESGLVYPAVGFAVPGVGIGIDSGVGVAFSLHVGKGVTDVVGIPLFPYHRPAGAAGPGRNYGGGAGIRFCPCNKKEESRYCASGESCNRSMHRTL